MNVHPKKLSFGFHVTGNMVLRLADEDSSIVVRIPGRFLVQEKNGVRTITQSGQTLYAPITPGEIAALRDFFGTDLVLVQGRTVSSERINPENGGAVEGSQRIVSANGRVTDLCEALAQ